jgi:hypothetical protein
MADGQVIIGGTLEGNYGDGTVVVGATIKSTSSFGKGSIFKDCRFVCGQILHRFIPAAWTRLGEGSTMEGGSCECSNWGTTGTVWGGVANLGFNVPAQYVDSPAILEEGEAVSETGGVGGLLVTPAGVAKDCQITTTCVEQGNIPEGISGEGWTQTRQGHANSG